MQNKELRRMTNLSCKKKAKPWGLTMAVVLVLAGLVQGEIDVDRRKCTILLMTLLPCLQFTEVGKGGSSPTIGCCKPLQHLLDRNATCVCILILDSVPSSQRVGLNLTRALLLPSLCHHPTNISTCIGLLNLPPNSAEANTFMQLAGAMDSKLPSNSSTSSGTMKCVGHWRCHKRRNLALVLGLLSALSLVGMVSIITYRKHKLAIDAKARVRKERKDILSTNSGGRLAKLFNGKDIKSATNYFSNNMLLGTGAFGEVYKGFLQDGTAVAVKIAKVNSAKGTEQVLNELSILSQVNHRSLVRLLGCCIELERPLLVYEFIPNGTLYDHIHTSRYGFLNWHQRLEIAHQAAEGLAYLHSSATSPIYHRDVKSSNILLDEKYNAKVSDFGLSRLVETDETHVSTCVQGTMGYLDPEYYRTYKLTDKSDVYSFGVVLLEMLTSKRALDFLRGDGDLNLVVYVQNMVHEGRILDAIDTDLRSGASVGSLEAMKALSSLALHCLEEKTKDRPSMKEVVEEIEYILGTEQIAALFSSKKL